MKILLADTITRLSQGQKQHLMLVLDDAHHLSQALLEELLTLAALYKHMVYVVVLFLVEANTLAAFKNKIPKKYHKTMLSLVSPLSREEALLLYQSLLERADLSLK